VDDSDHDSAVDEPSSHVFWIKVWIFLSSGHTDVPDLSPVLVEGLGGETIWSRLAASCAS